MSVLRSPRLSRSWTTPASVFMLNGISGIRMMSLPEAIPECSAIHPALRPITSTTITR